MHSNPTKFTAAVSYRAFYAVQPRPHQQGKCSDADLIPCRLGRTA